MRLRSALLLLLLAGCGPGLGLHPWPDTPLELASFTENGVGVRLRLERQAGGQDVLVATFTPVDSGCHLYSKDLPRQGIDGLGRPTLLELVPGSQLQVVGGLSESLPADQGEGPEGLLVYPPGPISLSMPVLLPEGEGWFEDQVSVTYMTCSDGTCTTPTIGKIIPVLVPGRDQP